MNRAPVLLLLPFVFTQVACSEDISSVSNPPVCRIVEPDSTAVISFGDTLVIVAEASDPDGGTVSVEFYVNETLWFVDHEPPYEYTLEGIPYRIGDHVLTAAAINEAGKRAMDMANVSILSESTPWYDIRVVNEFDHDPEAFTQGFLYDGGFFYEGTGQYGQSSIRRVDIESGDVLLIHRIPGEYFGEGIAVLGEMLYQLTWRSGIGFIYNKADFDSVGSFSYDTQGWGLTTDGETLVMSDGSATLYFMDPGTLDLTGQMVVTDQGAQVLLLNELEYIEGDVFANIYDVSSRKIARISMEDGQVVGWLDLEELAAPYGTEVLNGIAYDRDGQRLFVTGKNWDKVYEIELTFRRPPQ